MNERLTIRLSDDDKRALDERAALLDMSTAELARLAITANLSQQGTLDKIAKMFAVMEESNAERTLAQENKIRRAFKLIFRVIEAQPEAEQALDKIFE